MINTNIELDSTTNNEVSTLTDNQVEIKFQLWKSRVDTRNYKFITPEELLELLKSNATNQTYINMRQHYNDFLNTGDMEEKQNYDKLKSNLQYLTIPVELHPYRKTEYIKGFNNTIIFDFDSKDNPALIDNIKLVNQQISKDEFIFMGFVSPSGSGGKLMVRTSPPSVVNNIIKSLQSNSESGIDNTNDIRALKEYYQLAYELIGVYLKDKYNLIADSKANCILGGTYVSADEAPYFNPNSSLFEIKEFLPKKIITTQPIQSCSLTYQTSNYEILGEIEMYVEKYCDGRHNKTMYITLQATYYGIPENEIVNYCYSSFGAYDHTLDEIKRTVKDFYGKPYLGNQFIIRELYLKSC